MRELLRAVCLCGFVCLASAQARADFFSTTNLISNQPGVGKIQDANLVNPWGVSFSPTGPFWVSNNGTGTSTLYSLDASNTPTKLGLTVTIPDEGSVTGQVNTSGALLNAFNGDNFLFVSEDGGVYGWRSALGTTAERFQVPDPSNVFKGSAFGNVNGHSYLYMANFHTGAIDVLKGDSGAPALSGKFTDPTLPNGFAPFNVQILGGAIYVAYAKQGVGRDETPGAGLGVVNKFDLNGNLLGRVGTQGTLNAPWGMAIAPASFGAFAGDLLVGNFGDGRINAFNLSTNTFAGQLSDQNGNPLVIDGLWALTPGNGGSAGRSDTIYFTAGPNGETNGLFGAIALVPEPASATLFMIALGVGFVTHLSRMMPKTCDSAMSRG